MHREEYAALRATIRERGSLRVAVAIFGLSVWAALTLSNSVLEPPTWAVLPSLIVLAAAFEVVFALHIGVERVGRYLQVFYEEATDGPGWETHIMEFGRRFPGGGSDPLFCRMFWAATAVNLLPIARNVAIVDGVLLGLVHIAFASRIVRARGMAAGQRAIDLDRFRQLKASGDHGPTTFSEGHR